MKGCSTKKTFSRTLSGLTAIIAAYTVLLILPFSSEAAYSLPVNVEAEDCALGDGATVTTHVYETEYPGYSGDGFVWVSNAGTLTLEIAGNRWAL